MQSTQAAPKGKPKLEINVCYCTQKNSDDSLRHWMLMLNEPEAVKGDWIHSTGGPNATEIGTEGPGPLEDASKPQVKYSHNIQSGKRTKSFGIESIYPIGVIDASDRKKVIDASKAIDPQHCQMYVVALVAKLESKGLVKLGTTEILKPKIRMSEAAKKFRRLHRVPKPCLEWTKEEDDAFYA